MTIREATPADWPAIWRFMRDIVAAGETFSWDHDIAGDDARAMGPNHGGPASHVATASFMVDPASSGRGAGRALGERVLDQARADGYRAMQFNAVVESNTRAVALWRSLGFEVLTTVPEAFDHPTDGLVGLHIVHRPL